MDYFPHVIQIKIIAIKIISLIGGELNKIFYFCNGY